MEVLLKSIELIFNLLTQSKSLTGRRRREYFDEILRPLFDSVETVHDFYNELFLQTRREVQSLKIDRQPYVDEPGALSSDELTTLTRIKNTFLDQREQGEGLRDSLRMEAQDMFKAARQVEEQRFLASTIYYFLGAGGIAPEDSELDRCVAAVIEQGGIRYYDTPSVALYLRIRASTDLQEITNELDDARNRLNQAHMNTRRQFRRLQAAIIASTS